MQDNPIRYEQEEAVVTLTLNRPDALNAFSDAPMIEAFLAALDLIERDATVRAVILTGAGKAFSAGGNVKHMRDKTEMFAGGPATVKQAYLDGILRVPPRFWAFDRPVIAAVNGACFGAAVDLASMCDIRLAAPEAKIGLPFVNIGIGPGDGAAWFLPRIVGQSAAAELLLTGEPIDAEKALQIGFFSRIVPAGSLLEEAKSLARRIASRAPLAVRKTKQALRAGLEQSLRDHLQFCAEMQAALHHTEDHTEALEAFFEKREPVFRGV
ncbi:MAG: enoyl-CoA hydratase-related protein [Alphaproteobacteria bacterium]|nr:enoyl-CoA hydratase-related protein [Alphaproteobacteria bacterium]